MARFFLICGGGALGTGARYILSSYVAEAFGSDFPRGTLLINATGSFLIAFIMVLSLEAGLVQADARLFLTTGVMGGYTTYSSFNYETLKLVEQGMWKVAGLYLGLTVIGCLASGFLGLTAARMLLRVGAGTRGGP